MAKAGSDNAARRPATIAVVISTAGVMVEAMGKPKPEFKPPPFRLARFVQVPQAVYDKYAAMTWPDLVLAAQHTRDGLSIVDTNYYGLAAAAPGTAWLRENPMGGVFLYHQNW